MLNRYNNMMFYLNRYLEEELFEEEEEEWEEFEEEWEEEF